MGVLIGALVALPVSCASTTTDENALDLEQTVCGLKEPVAFWLWSSAAGRPDPSRVAALRNVEDLSLTTKDGRLLRGYKLGASSSAKGYLLVAQGNAMLADQILSSFTEFSDADYDVYVFDYRGYGRSEGKRRLKAILSDYGEIVGYLNTLPYAARRFYGMSFGGIVLLNVLSSKAGGDRVVIDSTPSRLSNYGCPKVYDPVANLPADSSSYLMIAGSKDRVVVPEQSKELLGAAEQRGGSVLRNSEFDHPFMDRDPSVHNRRMKAVMTFLLGLPPDVK